MRLNIASVVALMVAGLVLSACVVEPVAGPGPRPGCAWVPPHYGPWGGYHPGHCA